MNNIHGFPSPTQGIRQEGGFLGFSFDFIARFFISAFFIYTGIRAAMNFSEYKNYVQDTGVPYPALFAILSIVLQILGGLFFTGIFNITNGIGLGKFILLVYLILASAYSYNTNKDIENLLQNLAILGGILLA